MQSSRFWLAVPAALVLAAAVSTALAAEDHPAVALVKSKVKDPSKPFALLVPIRVKAGKQKGLQPLPEDADRVDADPLRCLDPEASARMVAEVDAAKKDADTLGGIVEVLAYGVPPGLGSQEHLIGFSHSRRGAEKNLEPAAALLLRGGEQCLG